MTAYCLIRWLISHRDPEREKKEAVKKKSDAILRRLDANGTTAPGSGRMEKLVLNSYEQTILTEVVAPEDINVSFDGVFALSPVLWGDGGGDGGGGGGGIISKSCSGSCRRL